MRFIGVLLWPSLGVKYLLLDDGELSGDETGSSSEIARRDMFLYYSPTNSVSNLDYVLFVVASETNIIYATLIHFPKTKRDTYLRLMIGVYDRCLKWAYVDAWSTNDPMTHLPEFREKVVSSKSYPVDRESLCFVYFVWKRLMEMLAR